MHTDCSHEDFAMSKRVGSKPAAQASDCEVGVGTMPLNFLTMYRTDPMERIRIVKLGIPAKAIEAMAERMAVPKEQLVATLGLTRATVDRKARESKPLSADDSARVLGMARLVGQVQEMVAESGDPTGFDAALWLARWLQRPLPAFGGQRPAEFMDTADGQSLVSTMVARMQTGAYS
jgi:putative toxin-antitoxin system antitoxin component (TIGR02293 family)